LQDSV
jgi:hypothetical protein